MTPTFERRGPVIAVEHFDTLVFGGGKAGKTLAMGQAKAGLRVAAIEPTPAFKTGAVDRYLWCLADALRSPVPSMPVRKYYSARR